jgi:hypothetical protein
MLQGPAILAALFLGSLQTAPSEVAGLVGFTGEVLATAGADVSAATAMLTALESTSPMCEELSVLESSCEALSLQMEAALASSWQGVDVPSEQGLSLALAAAREAVVLKREQIRQFAYSAVSPDMQARVATVLANASRRVSPEFRVLHGTEEWWSEVEKALLEERRSQRIGEPISPESASMLATIRADSSVQAAASGLAAHSEVLAELLSPPES